MFRKTCIELLAVSVFSHFVLEVETPRTALVELANELAQTAPASLVETTRVFGDWWEPKRWEFEHDTLLGPGGWSLNAGKKTITITHILRYGLLRPDNEYGPSVIDGVNFFAEHFGATSAIFCHELLNVPDLPLVESAKELSNEFAEAKNWDEARSAYFEDGCWLVVSLPIRAESI